MSTFISSSLQFLENSPISTSWFSDTTTKYAKIAAVALAIFSAVTALYYIYRCFSASQLNASQTVVPPHVSPKTPRVPTTPPQPTPPTAPPQPKPAPGNDPAARVDGQDSDKTKKVDPKPHTSPAKPSKSTEETDAALAQLMAAQWAAEEAEEQERQAREQQRAANQIKPKVLPSSLLSKPVTPTAAPTPAPAPAPSHPTAITVQPPQPAVVESPLAKPKAAIPSPFVQIENICGEIAEKTFIDSSFSAVKALSAVKPHTHQQVLHLLNEISFEFEKRYPVSRKIQYGEQVPAYFANVVEQSTYDRQYLSLMGIRNLLKYGPGIIDDFRDTKYLGGEHNYAHNRGLKLFKWATGNMVDLDIEIEAQDDAEAIRKAEPMIIQFGKMCGLKKAGGELTPADVARFLPHRRLDIPRTYELVHTSIDNVDRSNYGIWKRQSPANLKTYYYVNVPNSEIVLLATLRMPYMLAELLHRTKEYKGGILVKEFYNEYFSKGLSDKCFNDKARQFLDFYHTWSAKLEEVPTPEEDARRKIAKGVFGEALRQKGPDVVLKEAYTRSKLMNFLDNFNFEKKNRPFDQWIREESNKIRQILVDNHLWEEVLFRNAEDKDSDFFLLNQSTLNLFLKDYYDGMLD